jgi:RNA polymerase sigma-70 factor, ECF subfamily
MSVIARSERKRLISACSDCSAAPIRQELFGAQRRDLETKRVREIRTFTFAQSIEKHVREANAATDVSLLATAEANSLLVRYAEGDALAADRLVPLVYEELRRVARNHMRHESSDHTLQGTALVNEAFIRLNERTSIPWNNRVHFFRLASQVMRHVLVDHARAKLAKKRGGDAAITSLDATAANYHELCEQQLFGAAEADDAAKVELDFIALEDALAKLRELSPRQAQVVDLRFFGGLTLEEVAEVNALSLATVKRDWTMARLFLKRELNLVRANSTASP